MVRVIGVVGLRFGVWRPLGPLPVYRAPYKYPVAEACFLHLYTVCGTKIDPLTQSRVFVKLRSGRVTLLRARQWTCGRRSLTAQAASPTTMPDRPSRSPATIRSSIRARSSASRGQVLLNANKAASGTSPDSVVSDQHE